MRAEKRSNHWAASWKRRSRTSKAPMSRFACCAPSAFTNCMPQKRHSIATRSKPRCWRKWIGAKLTGPEINRADALRTALYQRVGDFFSKYEFFILPVTQVPAFDINQPYVTEIEGHKMVNYIDWMRSCYYISVLHNPAISVPGGFTAEGLPVGVQIVGRHHDDWGVLQMAYAFEQAAQIRKIPA